MGTSTWPGWARSLLHSCPARWYWLLSVVCDSVMLRDRLHCRLRKPWYCTTAPNPYILYHIPRQTFTVEIRYRYNNPCLTCATGLTPSAELTLTVAQLGVCCPGNPNCLTSKLYDTTPCLFSSFLPSFLPPSLPSFLPSFLILVLNLKKHFWSCGILLVSFLFLWLYGQQTKVHIRESLEQLCQENIIMMEKKDILLKTPLVSSGML